MRSIGFYLLGSPLGDETFVFGLRPEEVAYQEPSRLQVNQTIGGAWVDAYDRSIATISLSGTTGWRGGYVQSGEDLHHGLRETVFAGWHQGRAAAAEFGADPATVELWYVDSLNNITALVAPRVFTMRRSRASPLLMRYQIQLLVVQDVDEGFAAFDSIVNSFTDPKRWLLAVTGLGNVLVQIDRYLALARNAIGGFFAMATAFVNIGVGLITGVIDTARATVGIFGNTASVILGAAIDFCWAASNGFAVIATDASLLMSEVLAFQSLGNAFLDAACAMENGFDLISIIPDYSPLRGASMCSSTGGGDPISVFEAQDVNPFGYITPAAAPPVMITPAAQASMLALGGDPQDLMAQSDPINTVYSHFNTIQQGVIVS